MLTDKQRQEIKDKFPAGKQGETSEKAAAIIARYDGAQKIIAAHKPVEARAAEIADHGTLAPETQTIPALLARIEALEG